MQLLMPILTGEEQLNDDTPNQNGAKELGSQHESGGDDFAEQLVNDYRQSSSFSDLFQNANTNPLQILLVPWLCTAAAAQSGSHQTRWGSANAGRAYESLALKKTVVRQFLPHLLTIDIREGQDDQKRTNSLINMLI
jgi:hypothetical protein